MSLISKYALNGFLKMEGEMYQIISIDGSNFIIKAINDKQLQTAYKKFSSILTSKAGIMPTKAEYAFDLPFYGKEKVGYFINSFVTSINWEDREIHLVFDKVTTYPLEEATEMFTEKEIKFTKQIKIVNKFNL